MQYEITVKSLYYTPGFTIIVDSDQELSDWLDNNQSKYDSNLENITVTIMSSTNIELTLEQLRSRFPHLI